MQKPTSKQTRLFHAKMFPTEWHVRTNRAFFTWQEPRRKEDTVSYEDRKSTWNSGVQKVIRRGSAEEDRDRVTGAWKQISKQRRRINVSYDPSMVTALQHGTWMDEEDFEKTCIKEKKKGEAPAFLRYMGSRLHAETRCRKARVYAGEVSE